MKKTHTATLVLFVLVSILLVAITFTKKKDATVIDGHVESLESLLPQEVDKALAEPAALFSRKDLGGLRPTQVIVPLSPVKEVPPPAKGQQYSGTIPTVSYVYFYTGVPVRPIPMSNIVYTSQITPATPAMPVAQPLAVPIFIPQVVPAQRGAPKLVYTNGVVIRPKVYYPNQPFRNSMLRFTP
jgi:hypothetical protein